MLYIKIKHGYAVASSNIVNINQHQYIYTYQ